MGFKSAMRDSAIRRIWRKARASAPGPDSRGIQGARRERVVQMQEIPVHPRGHAPGRKRLMLRALQFNQPVGLGRLAGVSQATVHAGAGYRTVHYKLRMTPDAHDWYERRNPEPAHPLPDAHQRALTAKATVPATASGLAMARAQDLTDQTVCEDFCRRLSGGIPRSGRGREPGRTMIGRTLTGIIVSITRSGRAGTFPLPPGAAP